MSRRDIVSAIIARPERRELRCFGMMSKTKRYAYASALPAIAAALALSSTPAWSQEAQPTAEPDPISIAPPAPATLNPGTDVATITETAPAADTAPVAKPKSETVKASHPVASRKPATARSAGTSPTSTTAASMTSPKAARATLPKPTPEARPARTDQAEAAPEVAKPALNVDEDAIMLGGGALALLALGGGAVAFARRGKDEDDEYVEETATDAPRAEPGPAPRHDPVFDEQPTIVAPSAFAWGNTHTAESAVNRPNETWVERAYRGPTPDNPSLSLRKRLKRANFFDARERRVAMGQAEPIDAHAVLPESVASERELELA